MKRFIYSAFIGALICGFAACTQKESPEESETNQPIPESFPKTHLIEEFTGQACGYCPYGMDCISDFTANDTNWVLILHHYGYQADHFSVEGSKSITSKLKVNGAPSMTINRAQTNYGNGKAVVFHPGYLPATKKSQFDATTYASVNIKNEYNPSTRQLDITVSGALCTDDYPLLYLTVLVKESGMIDTQADYNDTYEGWEEFRHANAVRRYVTDPLGDDITVATNHRYKSKFTIAIDEKWVPENCMVVAFLSEEFQPVVQAAQAPVVANSKGGADLKHGGIKPVPVSDFYPEPDATSGPKNFSGNDADTLSVAYATYEPYTSEGFNFWQIVAYDSEHVVKVNRTNSLPYAVVCLFTKTDQKEIPEGTYQFDLSIEPGSAYAGYRDDEYQSIGGSEFYYISQSYFKQGYLVPTAEWLIVDGSITITADGWKLDGHARNGAEIHLVGTTPIANEGRAQAPRRQQPSSFKTICLDKIPQFKINLH